MASIELFSGFRSTFYEKFTSAAGELAGPASPTTFSIRTKDQSFSQTFIGRFSLNRNGRVKGGTISSFNTILNGNPGWTVSGLDLDINSYNNLFKTSKQVAFEGLFASDDAFTGSPELDIIFSYAGNDSVNAGDGDDNVDSGLGNDSILGGLGNDILFGSDGNDNIQGETGADSITGGVGNDFLDGSLDNDFLTGGLGDDSLFGAEGNDELFGNEGADRLFGGQGNDLLDGGRGPDLLTGGLGEDNFVTSDGASPELTALIESQDFELTSLVAENGVDIITDFSSSDRISASGQSLIPPFSQDGIIFAVGQPVFLTGTWIADTPAIDQNSGRFDLNPEGTDLFFFVATPDYINAVESQLPISSLDPSIFGSQLLVLLNASEQLVFTG